jgi:hypothetical protein
MSAPSYGGQHQQLRRQLLAVLKPGTPCPQPVNGKPCGKPMWPGIQKLDLGHSEHGGYIGIVHARCNQQDGAIEGNKNRGRTCVSCRQRFNPARKRQRRCESCMLPAAVSVSIAKRSDPWWSWL